MLRNISFYFNKLEFPMREDNAIYKLDAKVLNNAPYQIKKPFVRKEIRRNIIHNKNNNTTIVDRIYYDLPGQNYIGVKVLISTINTDNSLKLIFERTHTLSQQDVPSVNENKIEKAIWFDIKTSKILSKDDEEELPNSYTHNAALIKAAADKAAIEKNQRDEKTDKETDNIKKDLVSGFIIGAAVFTAVGIATGGFGFIGLGIYAGIVIAAAFIPAVAAVFTAISTGIRNAFKETPPENENENENLPESPKTLVKFTPPRSNKHIIYKENNSCFAKLFSLFSTSPQYAGEIVCRTDKLGHDDDYSSDSEDNNKFIR